MTAWQLFANEAENCGFKEEIAKKLYLLLKSRMDPTEKLFTHNEIQLTTEEAIRANYLLTKFGACLTYNYNMTSREETHKYTVKMLWEIK